MKRVLVPSISLALVCIIGTLAACSALQSQAPQKTIITSCAGYAAALNSAAAFREQGKLSAGQIGVVENIRPLATTLCTGPLPVDEASAIATVDALANQVMAVVGSK